MTFAVAAWLMSVGAASADSPQYEVWPEIDAWLRLSSAWRLSLYVPISKNLETNYREGNLIPQVDFAFGQTKARRRLLDEDRARTMRAFMVRGGYLGGRSLGDDGEAYRERTAFGEFHVRLPLKGAFLLSHRFRNELRFLGDDAEASFRSRYRLMIEKEYTAGRTSIVPYVNVEPYYDSRYETVNRIRLIGGGTVSWSPRTALETNVTYQYDSRSSVKDTRALNIILHLFFDVSRPEPASQP